GRRGVVGDVHTSLCQDKEGDALAGHGPCQRSCIHPVDHQPLGIMTVDHSNGTQSHPPTPAEILLRQADLSEIAFFTSYNSDGRLISYYGDNHPRYSGSVVKA